MARIVVGFAILAGLLLAFGVNVWELIFLALVLLIVVGGFSLIILQRLPRHFLLMLGALALGPCLLASIVRGWAQALLQQLGGLSYPAWSTPEWIVLALLFFAFVVGLIAYCILAARRRSERAQPEVRGAERTPLVPQHLDGERLI